MNGVRYESGCATWMMNCAGSRCTRQSRAADFGTIPARMIERKHAFRKARPPYPQEIDLACAAGPRSRRRFLKFQTALGAIQDRGYRVLPDVFRCRQRRWLGADRGSFPGTIAQ